MSYVIPPEAVCKLSQARWGVCWGEFRLTDTDLVTFTFMHLADAFIQSDVQLHSVYTFSLVHVFPGNRTHNLLRNLSG